MNESILIRQELLNKTKTTKYANNCNNEHVYKTKDRETRTRLLREAIQSSL